MGVWDDLHHSPYRCISPDFDLGNGQTKGRQERPIAIQAEDNTNLDRKHLVLHYGV